MSLSMVKYLISTRQIKWIMGSLKRIWNLSKFPSWRRCCCQLIVSPSRFYCYDWKLLSSPVATLNEKDIIASCRL